MTSPSTTNGAKADAEVTDRVLAMLRQWGWKPGVRRLAAALEGAEHPAQALLRGWRAVRCGDEVAAREQFRAAAALPALAGWAAIAEAQVAYDQRDLSGAEARLAEAIDLNRPPDAVLTAACSYVRGLLRHQAGALGDARSSFHEALEGVGENHSILGMILNGLGSLYTTKDNFHAAREFFHASRRHNERHGRTSSTAFCHGQLTRLYLSWGLWDRAESHLHQDYRICQNNGDEHGQAYALLHLGELALARAEFAPGHRPAHHRAAAIDWLTAAVDLTRRRHWAALEGLAMTSRALVDLHGPVPDVSGANKRLDLATEQFERLGYAKGLAHVAHARGVAHRIANRPEDALASLLEARRQYERAGLNDRLARVQWEIARVQRDAGRPRPIVALAYREALASAEASRRVHIVRAVEAEFAEIAPGEHAEHLFRRVRGPDVGADTASLMSGSRESATIMFFDLEGSTALARLNDPEDVFMTLNQMMAEFAAVLRRHDARMNFRGDGFLATLRGSDHALRAVTAALEMFAALREFNWPRCVLNLPSFKARVGIATGELMFGNVGTYDKMDFEPIGTTANLAARIQTRGQEGAPCICRTTYEVVRERFQYKPGGPRVEVFKGIGEQPVWDVEGPAADPSA
jgi:class 3 adenylate cyclase